MTWRSGVSGRSAICPGMRRSSAAWSARSFPEALVSAPVRVGPSSCMASDSTSRAGGDQEVESDPAGTSSGVGAGWCLRDVSARARRLRRRTARSDRRPRRATVHPSPQSIRSITSVADRRCARTAPCPPADPRSRSPSTHEQDEDGTDFRRRATFPLYASDVRLLLWLREADTRHGGLEDGCKRAARAAPRVFPPLRTTGEPDTGEHENPEGFVVRVRSARSASRRSSGSSYSGGRSRTSTRAENTNPEIRSGSVTGSRQRAHWPR